MKTVIDFLIIILSGIGAVSLLCILEAMLFGDED